MESFFGGFSAFEIPIASEDGSQLYRFKGRPPFTDLKCPHWSDLYSFSYDSTGRLAQITDGDGNITTIERNINGDATAISGPYGQRTTLGLDENGYLARITNPWVRHIDSYNRRWAPNELHRSERKYLHNNL